MIWEGNNRIFRTYFKGDDAGDGKKPCQAVKGMPGLPFAEAAEKPSFGAVLKEGYVDISFDSKEMFEAFLDMADANNWRCLALESAKGGHTYWKDSGRKTGKNGKDKPLAVGLIADIHSGSTYIPLRVHGVDRFPPVYDILPGEDYQEVPPELLPVKTSARLWGLSEGEGRNDELFSYILTLQESGFDRSTIRHILTNTNNYCFAKPLPKEELQIILRDESFTKNEAEPMQFMSFADLMQTDLPPVQFIVKDALPVGLSIIAAPPKFGKSWFCLDLALSVAAGSPFLGFETRQSGVLYLALEDSFNRLKDRIMKVLGDRIPDAGFNASIQCETLQNGLIKQLEGYIEAHPETRLIIIDTFAKVRDGGKKNEGAYTTDYREAGQLKHFADENGVAVLLVHHLRKMIDPNDPFANFSGTNGLTGAVDTMFSIAKEKRADATAKLSVSGRDVTMNEYAIKFNETSCRWEMLSDSYEDMKRRDIEAAEAYLFIKNPVRQTVVNLLEEQDSWKGSAKDFKEAAASFGLQVTMTGQALGKTITGYTGLFFRVDKISCTMKRLGTGGSIYIFEKIKTV